MEFFSTPGVVLELPLTEISGSVPLYFVRINALKTCAYNRTELSPSLLSIGPARGNPAKPTAKRSEIALLGILRDRPR